jgi:hypothetical protein
VRHLRACAAGTSRGLNLILQRFRKAQFVAIGVEQMKVSLAPFGITRHVVGREGYRADRHDGQCRAAGRRWLCLFVFHPDFPIRVEYDMLLSLRRSGRGDQPNDYDNVQRCAIFKLSSDSMDILTITKKRKWPTSKLLP